MGERIVNETLKKYLSPIEHGKYLDNSFVISLGRDYVYEINSMQCDLSDMVMRNLFCWEILLREQF